MNILIHYYFHTFSSKLYNINHTYTIQIIILSLIRNDKKVHNIKNETY